jgi:hypothetical protein
VVQAIDRSSDLCQTKKGVAAELQMYIMTVERLIPSGVLPPTSESGSPLIFLAAFSPHGAEFLAE